MKFLITGSNGLLGQKIVKQLVKNKIPFIATSKGENRNPDCPSQFFQSLDITVQNEISEIIKTVSPTVIINTAAMTNVDECETDEENCSKINIDAVKFLYSACSLNNIHFIQLSTDFVFDGLNGPYKEDDKRNPLNIYAKSKVAAEDILLNGSYNNWAIIRTIIVYGQANNLSRSNILLWAREALKNGQELKIVNDQFRAPTWADDLAWACINVGKKSVKGVYHISGGEIFSIYELVLTIANFYSVDSSKIIPVSSETLNQKAKRPKHTGFVLTKAQNTLGYHPISFTNSLQKLEKELG